MGIPLPACCSLGSCCKGASPSKPYHQLLKRAAEGDDFARGFFSIMVPYQNHQEAEAIVPGLVERTLKAAKKLSDFAEPEKDIVFYQCRYQTEDNRCGVWEDRPQFCRDYPDTPFVVMAPGCAFEGWGAACKKKYGELKDEVERLQGLKQELHKLKRIQQGLSVDADGETDGSKNLSASTSQTILATTSFGFNLVDELDNHNEQQAAYAASLSIALSLTPLYVGTPLPSIYFLWL